MPMRLTALITGLILAPCAAATPRVVPDANAQGQPQAYHASGRSVADASGVGVRYQWPGQVFQTHIQGDSILFDLGAGDVIAHVQVDGERITSLSRPAAGRYRVEDLGPGTHTVSVQIATEHQAGAKHFGGFFAPDGVRALPLARPQRQIEFIGDSHTVGYGSISSQRECTEEQVWESTDNTVAYGPLLAARFQADYRVNAISGRGIVRNYNGFAADSLPQAYPWLLLDHSAPAPSEAHWQPDLVVVALGTNDFSTALNPGERWADRQALRDDYVSSYVQFAKDLRQRYPAAELLLWSTDLLDGEISEQVSRVEAQLRSQGEQRLSRIVLDGLAMDACHAHPSLADHQRIAARIAEQIGRLDLWKDSAAIPATD